MAVGAVLVVAVAVWGLLRVNASADPTADTAASSAANPAVTSAAPLSSPTNATGPVPATSAPTPGVPTPGSTTSGPAPSADPPPTGSAAPSGAAVPSAAGAGGRERPAVAPASSSTGGGGPTVRLSSIGHVAGQALGPGEIAGPAIRVSIVIENGGSANLDLTFVAVNAYIGTDRRPAGTLTQPAGSPFGGVLKPGERATGVYLFTVPTAERDQVTLVVDYLAGQPAAVFTGAF
ncbi:MAG: hypothetical protein ABIW80_13960 [Lapillicoccus sp.]